MSTIRKNPPPLAPSRIAGTLKVRKPTVEEAAETPAAPTATADEGTATTPRRAPADKPGRSVPEKRREGARAPHEGRTSPRPPAPRRTEADARPREPARRERPASAERLPREARDAGKGGAPARGAEQAPARKGPMKAPMQGPMKGSGRGPDKAPVRGAPPQRAEKPARRQGPDAAPRKAVPDAAAPHRPVPGRPSTELPTELPTEGVRLSKVMAERGICSRREADEFIERGWVFVDGRRVSELGIRIDPEARITLAPEATRTQRERVTILLHKPVGYVSGQPEPGYEPAVSLIGAGNQFDRDSAQRFHPSQLKNLAPAGRLDIDSTGLLVLTQDGRVARQLIGDDSNVDKEYLVRVEGELAENGLALLNHGLWLDERPLRPAQVEWINDDQLRFVLREGRKRQIRRMCELVGLKVVGLKRVRIGRVKLGELPLGQWRFLREDETF